MNCISMRILGAHNLKTASIQLKIIILVVVDEVKLISGSEFKPSIPKACLSLGLFQPLSSSSGTTLHSAFLLSHNRYHRQQEPPPVGGRPIISTSCPLRGSPSVCVCVITLEALLSSLCIHLRNPWCFCSGCCSPCSLFQYSNHHLELCYSSPTPS